MLGEMCILLERITTHITFVGAHVGMDEDHMPLKAVSE